MGDEEEAKIVDKTMVEQFVCGNTRLVKDADTDQIRRYWEEFGRKRTPVGKILMKRLCCSSSNSLDILVLC